MLKEENEKLFSNFIVTYLYTNIDIAIRKIKHPILVHKI